jgi:hypothetical protein
VFPVRYELNVYINLLRNSVFKGLISTYVISTSRERSHYSVSYYITIPQKVGLEVKKDIP